MWVHGVYLWHTFSVGGDRPRDAVHRSMTRAEHFSHPGRWWQPCVTPYFATRGRGDMRGVPMGIPPNRTPEGCGAVAPNIVHCVSAVYLMIFVWCDDGLPPPPGWHFLGVPPPSPHVADTRRRNTGLRTAATPRGVANYLALGHSSPPRGEACDAPHRSSG